jgi:EAL domain-containing protein (putative c-di-GMP-specific phosphodiesterase class I)
VAHPDSTSLADRWADVPVAELIRNERLQLVFQPIVSLHGRSEKCYEVLLRVCDEVGRYIPTADVFTAAAAINQAGALDEWVIEQVLKTAGSYHQNGDKVRFFVKLSEHAIKDEAVLLHLTKMLARSNVDPSQLVFQINEATLLRQIKTARVAVNFLKGLNCPTALEHFGTGMNSFNALTHLDADHLKLDGSFLDGLAHDTGSQQTLREIQQTASRLNKETIATSVQDANCLAILWQCGVNLAQGHYIQEPTPELSYEFHDSTD